MYSCIEGSSTDNRVCSFLSAHLTRTCQRRENKREREVGKREHNNTLTRMRSGAHRRLPIARPMIIQLAERMRHERAIELAPHTERELIVRAIIHTKAELGRDFTPLLAELPHMLLRAELVRPIIDSHREAAAA